MKLSRKVGSTSQILQIFIQDSSSTVGAGLTGLTNATSNLVAYYHRDTDTTATAISLVSMTVGTFTSSGFKEIDSSNMPGWYQFCPPNAAFNSGAASVGFHLKGASNMAPLPIEVDLDSQVDVTFWNGTVVATPATAGIPDVNTKNINNVAAATPGASGGILISGSNSGTTTLGALTVTGATTHTGNMVLSDGLTISAPSTTNRAGITVTGNGTGAGLSITGGNGATGNAVDMIAAATNSKGLNISGLGSGAGMVVTGGATGIGLSVVGGGTSGDGIKVVTTSGHGVNLAPVGTSKHGLFTTGGNGGTSDGISAVAGTGGVPIRGDITGNVTGNLSGSVGSVTGSVGSVTGAVGSVTGAVGSVTGNVGGNVVGSVASVTARVTANTDQLASQTVTAAAGVTFPTSVASPTNLTAGTITTVSGNVNGSVGSVTGAVGSVTGAVGSVTGNVGGNVVGSVGSVTGNVGGNVTGSVGSVVAAVTPTQVVRANTAAAGGATTITLDGGASASNSFYVNDLIVITGGTGAGQARFITAYVGATKVATVTAWTTNPDNTSTFAIYGYDAIVGATAPTSAQNATAVWQDLLAGTDFGTAGSIGALLKLDVDAAISTRTKPADTQAAVTTVTNLTNAPTAGDFTATMKTSLNAATPVASLSVSERNAVADALLDRDMSVGVDSGSPTVRTVRQALRFLRNLWSIVGTTLTVYKEDDVTTSWTSTLTTTPGADPVTKSDPAGP